MIEATRIEATVDEPETACAPRLRVVAAPPEVLTGDGASARLEPGEGGERLVLRDPGGRALFEYRPGDGRCVVHVPRGDLVLRTDEGGIELDSARGLRLGAKEAVTVEAEEVRLTGGLLESTFRRARQRIDILEVTAGRIVERAIETYREVTELAQLRAGRVRQVAEGSYHVLGERTLFKARKDIKLKGEKIHLG
jgi:hypothetical protein